MQPFANIIILNARILTMDEAAPNAEAIAIAGKTILSVRSNDEIETFRGPGTRVIDAAGGTVLPGFNEAHMHIFMGSVGLRQLSLYKVKGFDELKAKVSDYAAKNPKLKLLLARSADYTILSETERTTRHDLDRVISDRPFAMISPDHHTAWANTKALELAGLLNGRQVSVGNEVVMGEDGLASGELREADAMQPVFDLSETGGREGLGIGTGGEPGSVTPQERAIDLDIIRDGLAYCASLGITSIQNMDGNLYQLEILEEIENTSGLPVRVRMPYHMKNFMPLSDLSEKAATWRDRFHTDRLRCNFVKMFIDGVTEGESAVFLEDYAHKPGWKGDPLFSQEHLNQIVTEADRLELPVAVHAIGDGAVRMVLDAYEAAAEANGSRDARNRIEHIEVVHPDDVPRFKSLGVIASMQPTHPPGNAGLPLEPYLSFIGRDRWPLAFAWRTLADAGAEIVFATDWPVSPLDPMGCIHDAMTRQRWADDLPDQRLTLTETLAAYTSTGAHVEFMEDRKGMLKPGYLADIVLLSSDVEAAASEHLASIRPVVTICDGKITYEKAPV
ncbi:amidohydrolase [Rhizobium wenxiniae]|uniref:amidohydrolase n=1 Tax=Rhizobium wenxiniae TaxID=1737357 RepID=UPI001C6E7FF8|nr:amidohydrolase [Rhizobium wenxiniae]MBW9090974.1 amidohydrolase [Rhizobium wenxiniae]